MQDSVSKTNKQLFEELKLKTKVCRENKDDAPVDSSDELTNAIVQSNATVGILAPNTGFLSNQNIGGVLIVSSVLIVVGILSSKSKRF